MKTFILLFVNILPISLFAQVDATKILSEGTVITVQLLQDISSKTANTGDVLDFETSEQIIVNNNILVPKGEKVTGKVTDSERAKGLGKSGTLKFSIDFLSLADGKIIKLTSDQSAKGQNKLGASVAEAVLLTPLFLLKKGKNIKFEKGHIFKVFVSKDYQL
jgi:hypothetical protein